MLLLVSCSDAEQSELESLKKANAKAEYIYRNHDDFFYALPPPNYRKRGKYPWETNLVGNYPKITKEFFRCKGKGTNPPHIEEVAGEGEVHHFDCGGGNQHSLPIRDGKEFIYPILIDLLNYIQARTEKKVIVTCGHRCPIHNAYSDLDPSAQTSKHMIGAEVSFYVAGMENTPEAIIDLIFRFYQENARYRGKEAYEYFERYEKSDTNVSIPPWYNKEVFVKLFQKGEGRNLDNSHPFPYISIQVRHDRDKNERVAYSWPKAHRGYHRY